MPIYEFSCEACGRVFDLMIMARENAELQCPDCGSSEVVKIMSSCSHSLGKTGSVRSGGPAGVATRSCGSGSCATIDIPGRER